VKRIAAAPLLSNSQQVTARWFGNTAGICFGELPPFRLDKFVPPLARSFFVDLTAELIDARSLVFPLSTWAAVALIHA